MNHDVAMSISEAWLAGLLLVSAAGLFLLARYVGKPRRAVPVRLSEEGVSYSLSFILVVPFIMMFCVLVVETVFIHMARIGVAYAAYAGNRSAVVWISAKPANVRKERITQSVLTALAPFTWKRFDRYDAPNPRTVIAGKTAASFFAAYYGLTREADESRTVSVADAVLRYGYASGKTGMSVLDDKEVCTVRVEYRYRCLFGFAGRILDKDHRAPFEIVMQAESKLPSERSGGLAESLSIDYHSETPSQGPGPGNIRTSDIASQ